MPEEVSELSSPVVVTTIAELRERIREAKQAGQKIGCVPTMGALHVGHTSLVDQARQECEFVVATIFVNPTQFAPGEDYEKYPRPLKADVQKCADHGVDLVFAPSTEEMYPKPGITFVEVEELATRLEGVHRPSHFRGVTTVVAKLFNIVQPDFAYFGLKDYQQQLILRRMCDDLDFPVTIQSCPTVRDEDGLALSSRNQYLSSEERQTALAISRGIFAATDRLRSGKEDVAQVQQELHASLESEKGLALDYAVIADAHTLESITQVQAEMVILVAARVGSTRLIDNLPVSLSSLES